jgi:hypothetical protein
MTEISAETAIAAARREIGLPAAAGARHWRVRRLDATGQAYYLVVFGNARAAVGIADVDSGSGQVKSWARLPGSAPHGIIDAERAIKLAGGDVTARAELVWKPCRASRSPFYPIWLIHSSKKAVYLDQQGQLWNTLEDGGAG